MNMQTGKAFKWLAGGLIFSLALNLFLGGFLVTHMMRPDPFSIFPKIPIHQLIDDLPKDTRENARALMRARHPVLHQQFEAMKQAQARLQQAIKADPIKRDDLNAAFDNLRRTRAALEQNLQSAFVDIIVTVPAKERGDLAMHWYRPPHQDGRHFWTRQADKNPPPPQPAAPSPSPAP